MGAARPWESPYLYVGGNPVVRIDPLGLYWVDTNGDGIADTWVLEEPIVVEVLPFYPTSDPGADAIRSPMIEIDDLLGSKAIAKGFAKAGSVVIAATVMKQAIRETKPLIKITQDGLAHVIERHTLNELSQFVKKSKFLENVNIPTLIQKANEVNPISQPKGRLAWIVDAGTNIGVDRVTKQPVQVYTVITESTGELVTAFPGLP